VEGKGDMTVTHREHDGDVTWSKHWGPERLVEIYREPKTSLGLSIVGGKVRYIYIYIYTYRVIKRFGYKVLCTSNHW